MYEKPRVNVKVERGSTFTFTRDFSYITSILIYARKLVKVYVRTHVKITRQWKSTFSAHCQGQKIEYAPKAVNRINAQMHFFTGCMLLSFGSERYDKVHF